MNNTLIDNSEKYLMRDILRQFIGSGRYNHICIATGYWDLPGMALVYDELKAFFEAGGRLDILIGQEPQLRTYQMLPQEPDQHRFPDFYIQRDINLLTDEYRPTAELIQRFCNVHKYEGEAVIDLFGVGQEEIPEQEDPQIQIRVFGQKDKLRKQFLHAKCYIFLNKEEGEADGIIGSSNFTQKGLEDNAELNYLETNSQVVASEPSPYVKTKSHKTWFEEKWEQSEPWNGQFLRILAAAPVGQPKPEPEEDVSAPLTPYELYIKLLQIKFGHLVDVNLGQQIQSYLPPKYDTYNYQIDAVKQCYATMKEHGGFLLADVVGLGKTIVGILLIRHYLQFPDEDGRDQKVLIITPPAIQSAWKNTIDDFDSDTVFKLSPYIDFITTGSIGKLIDDVDETDLDDTTTDSFEGALQRKNYGLILIDESHKFRNSDTAMYQALDELIECIGGEAGEYPYIGLLSATPQNNRPSDLQNQIYLFERNHAESTLKRAFGGNLEGFFADINRRYAAIIHDKDEMTPDERDAALKQLSGEIRDCVLCDIMVRRTRTDVNKYYKQDKDKQGLTFPEIEGPLSLQYKMSKTLAHLFFDTMNCIAPESVVSGGLMYYRYRAIQFLKDPEMKRKYDARGSRDADALADQLARIMQMNLVKRLESSFTAFKQSLLNLRQYTQNMIDMWERDTIFICPAFNVNEELNRKKKEQRRGHAVTLEDCFCDIRFHINKLNAEGRNADQSNYEYHRADFDPIYIEYLRQDLRFISDLCDRWSKNSEDPKFDEFKENLRFTLFNPATNGPQKLVIFTEAIDTAESIGKAAESKGYNVLCITAANRKDMEPTIRENFDANFKGEWKDDYDIIVTTDVLAEGINLHRANCILNYDTPWNSTRLMQRIGRVNRIGSTEPKVYVYNFMPSAEGDAEIKLVQKAHTKLQSFHTLFGEDSQIFSHAEEVTHYDLNEQVNGKESPLEKYLYELKQYKASHPLRYAMIAQATEGLELATTDSNGTSYFLVRTPRVSGMFVCIKPTEAEGTVVSLAEGLEAFRVDENAVAVTLPEKWPELRAEAERVMTAELASSRMKRGNTRKATEAKEAIKTMKEQQQMSADSKKLLSAADRLIRQGNSGIIKSVLKIAEAVRQQNLLIPYTQEEFDAYLSSAISNIVNQTKLRQGNPQVVLGTYKC